MSEPLARESLFPTSESDDDVQIIRAALRALRQIVPWPDGTEPLAIATAEACCDALDARLLALRSRLEALS